LPRKNLDKRKYIDDGSGILIPVKTRERAITIPNKSDFTKSKKYSEKRYDYPMIYRVLGSENLSKPVAKYEGKMRYIDDDSGFKFHLGWVHKCLKCGLVFPKLESIKSHIIDCYTNKIKKKELVEIAWDYDDLLKRAIYRIDNSLELNSKKEFSKAVFNYCFYLCTYLEKTSCSTLSIKIRERINHLISLGKIESEMNDILLKCLNFRRSGVFKGDYLIIRKKFITYIIKAIARGNFHARMTLDEFRDFLTSNGFTHLNQICRSKR